MSIWEQVEALVAEGKGAVITLTEANEVKLPRRKTQSLHKTRRFDQYAGSTDGTSRPRCRARGCQNYLKVDQPIVCCDKCGDKVVRDAIRILALMKYHVIERLDDFDEEEHTKFVLDYASAEGLI